MDTIFNSEAVRLYSFTTWPLCKVTGSSLAKAGFYYTQEKDYVKCFHCEIKLANWKDQDPVFTHLNYNKKCEFMLGWPCKNIPVKGYSISPMAPRVWMRSQSLANFSQKTPRKPSVIKTEIKAAFSRRYANCTHRLRTFKELDWNGLTDAATMAEAGFSLTTGQYASNVM